MIKSELNDTDRLRIIRYDCEISRNGRIMHSRHSLTFIPRNSMGELCPMKSIYGVQDKCGAWALVDNSDKKIGNFFKVGELIKYAKLYLKNHQ